MGVEPSTKEVQDREFRTTTNHSKKRKNVMALTPLHFLFNQSI